VRIAFQHLTEAAAELRRHPGSGPLTISTMPSLAAKWLVPRLFDFRTKHPDIEVRISATEKLEAIGVADIDVGLRYGRGQWPDLQAELLLADEIFPVCSPKLLDGPRPLRAPEDLVHFSLITDAEWRLSQYDFWQHWLAAAGIPDLDATIGLTFDQSNLMIQAAIDGLGVALGNTMLAADDIRAGRLTRPFALTVKLATGYYLAYAKEALRQPKILAFRNWIHDQMRQFSNPENAP
jgi:LysR family transcriptional regulator, glycine cleavage system transcriptional activator